MKPAQIASISNSASTTLTNALINQSFAQSPSGSNSTIATSRVAMTAINPLTHQAAAAGVRTGSGNSLTSSKTSHVRFLIACHIAGYSVKNRVNTWFATRYAPSASRNRPSSSHTSSPSAVSSANSAS